VEHHVFKRNPSLSFQKCVLLRIPRDWFHVAKYSTLCAVCIPFSQLK
jgi:hypothetical protein